MTWLCGLPRKLSFRRKNQQNQPSSSFKEDNRIDEIKKRDPNGSSQEKGSKAPCLDTQKKDMSLVIPNDVIFEILSKLPAEFLWKVGRYVCRDWNRMTLEPCFINSVALKPSLLLYDFLQTHKLVRLYKEDPLSSPEFEEAQTEFRFPGRVQSTSDGLWLIQHNGSLYVANPLTKQLVELPSPTDEHGRKLTPLHSYIVRVPNTGEFKVICFSSSKNPDATDVTVEDLERVLKTKVHKDGPLSVSCFMLTIGINMTWAKRSDVPVWWFENMVDSILLCSLSIKGVIYVYDSPVIWPPLENSILVIDLRSDKLCTHMLNTPIRTSIYGRGSIVSYGTSCLGFVDVYDDQVDIWMLKDLHENKWEITRNFRFFKWLLDGFFIGSKRAHIWLESSQTLIFLQNDMRRSNFSIMAYNISTEECQQVSNLHTFIQPAVFIHSSSLAVIRN